MAVIVAKRPAILAKLNMLPVKVDKGTADAGTTNTIFQNVARLIA